MRHHQKGVSHVDCVLVLVVFDVLLRRVIKKTGNAGVRFELDLSLVVCVSVCGLVCLLSCDYHCFLLCVIWFSRPELSQLHMDTK